VHFLVTQSVIDKIPLLSQTCDSFAHFIKNKLGKGSQHAALVYEEWFRTGRIEGKNPAFNNAKALLNEILSLTDLSFLPLSGEKHDGQTGKFLLRTSDGLEIESVLIPMQAGGTLCISSQVGCRMGCAFCETGRMGLLRNLTPEEILSQVFVARFLLGASIRNIVFMGMGEPLDNYDAVMQAVHVLIDSHGFGFGKNHITLSTSGCLDGIHRLMEEKGPIPNLAISVNASNDLLRNKLMPVNRKHNMQELRRTMEAFCRQTGKQILIAYVLIKDKNDSLEHAEELCRYLEGLPVKINLIPYNAQSHDRYQSPTPETVETFTRYLRQKGYYTLLRQTKGDKIMAACGQLGNLKLKRSLSMLSMQENSS
jgi:23S rRNA (adenine2503-C2)-methyltransferase